MAPRWKMGMMLVLVLVLVVLFWWKIQTIMMRQWKQPCWGWMITCHRTMRNLHRAVTSHTSHTNSHTVSHTNSHTVSHTNNHSCINAAMGMTEQMGEQVVVVHQSRRITPRLVIPKMRPKKKKKKKPFACT
jgi:hypothetical protein